MGVYTFESNVMPFLVDLQAPFHRHEPPVWRRLTLLAASCELAEAVQ